MQLVSVLKNHLWDPFFKGRTSWLKYMGVILTTEPKWDDQALLFGRTERGLVHRIQNYIGHEKYLPRPPRQGYDWQNWFNGSFPVDLVRSGHQK